MWINLRAEIEEQFRSLEGVPDFFEERIIDKGFRLFGVAPEVNAGYSRTYRTTANGKAVRQAWREANREKERGYDRAYREKLRNSPELRAEYNRKRREAYARSRSVVGQRADHGHVVNGAAQPC